MLIFFDSQSVVHKEFVPKRRTVNAEFYKGVMRRPLKRIQWVRPAAFCYRDVFSFNDNAEQCSAESICVAVFRLTICSTVFRCLRYSVLLCLFAVQCSAVSMRYSVRLCLYAVQCSAVSVCCTVFRCVCMLYSVPLCLYAVQCSAVSECCTVFRCV